MRLTQPIIQMSREGEARMHEVYTASFRVAKNETCVMDIEQGFRFDGASIPKFLWSIVGNPWQGEYLPASVVHDALYATEFLPRDICDTVFYDLLRRQGVGKIKAYIMYLAVRAFGASLWPHSKHSIETARYYCQIRFFPPRQ